MLGTSLPELIFVRVGTLALHSITPLSIICAVLPVITSIIWPWPLQAYFAAETLFYLFWYLPWKRRLEQVRFVISFAPTPAIAALTR
jgi:hypothetical protein